MSGCAILPINRRTVSRGSLVSESRVTTYRTSCGGDGAAPTHVHEGGVGGPAEKSVQFMKFAPLPLPANPAPFTFVPDPPTVQQEEPRARGRGAVTSIEAFNAFACEINQFRVAFRSIDVRIDPIR